MRTGLLLLCSLFLLSSCSDAPNSTQDNNNTSSSETSDAAPILQEVIDIPAEQKRGKLDLAAIFDLIKASQTQHESLKKDAFFASYINDALYFYTIKGPFSTELWGEKQNEINKGAYQCGLVNANNEPIIPCEFDKIYNMGGVAANLIEVERNGKLGAYDITGKEVLQAEFDGIYPYKGSEEIWVQVRKGNQYGWLRKDGQLFMDKNSHSDANLFQAQSPADLIKNWAFDSKSETFHPIFDITAEMEMLDNGVLHGIGIIVMPSYLSKLGIVPEYQSDWMFDHANFGLESTDIKIIDSEATQEGGRTILAAFGESFAYARGHSEDQSEIVTVDANLEKVDQVSIERNWEIQDCDSEIKFKFIDNSLLEVAQPLKADYKNYDAYMTSYSYYNISPNGNISPMTPNGQFKFTRVLKINEDYFKGCFTRSMTEAEEAEAAADPDLEYYSYASLKHLSIDDLDIMRNEIFAAHGYKFKKPAWQNYFKTMSWYKPQFDNVDDKLTDIEKHNIQVILDMKAKMKGKEADYLKKSYDFNVAAG